MNKDIKKPFKVHNSTQIVICRNLFNDILVIELYKLPKCIVSYKQSLS